MKYEHGFKNVKAFISGEIITTDIAVENGKIVDIGSFDISSPYSVEKDEIVLPAFIDEHIHGAEGSDAMDGNVKDIKTIANALKKEGTALFLATTMTQRKENIIKSLNAVDEFIKTDDKEGAEVLGVHLEGPFISTEHIGAQPLEYVAKPDCKLFDEYNKASGNHIKIVSLAPEVEGANTLIKHLKESKVVASAGHTHAKYDDIEKAIENGLTCITHTYNAQRPIHHREIGTVGSAMLFDCLYTEMICDLIHLSAPAIKLLIKNKPKDKVVLITDAMRAKGLKDGESELGGQKVIVKNGEARLVDGTLAGSILKMNIAIKNIVEKCDVSFKDAITFATANPAKNLGVFDKYGSIEIGKVANFTVLDKDYCVMQTIREGKVIYKA